MAETLNLIQKLAKIRAISDVVAKEKRGYNYSYADITTILAKITAGMKKYGVSLIPQIVPGTANVEQSVSSTTKFTKTGDVDAYRSKQKEAESSEDRAIAEEIISQFDSLVRTFLADNPGKSDEVKTFVKRYIKSGNYLSIKEPALAADLLAKFNEKFITK